MQPTRLNRAWRYRVRIVKFAMGFLAAVMLQLAAPDPSSAATLDRVRQAGKLTLGYRADARPFSYRDGSGNADGYAVGVCKAVAEQLKSDSGLSTLNIEWAPVSVEDQFRTVQEGKVDLLCGAAETLTSREEVDFSLPIFPGGIGVLVRANAPLGLREVLSGRPPSGPLWRGRPAQILEKQTFSVVAGTPSEKWLADRLDTFQLSGTIVPVKSYEEGVQRVLDGSSSVFFSDRSILLDTVKRSPSGSSLTVLDRRFNYAPLALALERGDSDFRLVVDRALSHYFSSENFRNLYMKWFGEPDSDTDTFFRFTILPE